MHLYLAPLFAWLPSDLLGVYLLFSLRSAWLRQTKMLGYNLYLLQYNCYLD